MAAMLDHLELFGMGWSWGGYESLLIPIHPGDLPHGHAVGRRGRAVAHPCRARGSGRPDHGPGGRLRAPARQPEQRTDTTMTTPTAIQEIGAWVTGAGLAGMSESQLLDNSASAWAGRHPAGARLAMVDTFHPISKGAPSGGGAIIRGQPARRIWPHQRDEQARPSGNGAPSTTCTRPAQAMLRRRLARGDPPGFPDLSRSCATAATPTTWR